jgi:DNA-binding NarL/FixJ family response regulator
MIQTNTTQTQHTEGFPLNNVSVTKPNILIIEDHEYLRSIIGKWIMDLFPESAVHQSGSGEDGVALAQSLNPKIVLMDIGLPGMNGIAATKLIKRSHPHTNVIVLTIFNDPFYETEAKKAGAVAFVSKSDMYVRLPELIKTHL